MGKLSDEKMQFKGYICIISILIGLLSIQIFFTFTERWNYTGWDMLNFPSIYSGGILMLHTIWLFLGVGIVSIIESFIAVYKHKTGSLAVTYILYWELLALVLYVAFQSYNISFILNMIVVIYFPLVLIKTIQLQKLRDDWEARKHELSPKGNSDRLINKELVILLFLFGVGLICSLLSVFIYTNLYLLMAGILLIVVPIPLFIENLLPLKIKD
ncbi:MAG: hypothetical protein HWN65_21735 [Candidatus Helarchaeota archaeon]|nr:hypothetical protein [Candidatus Helarchaeota archaeon]